MTGNSSFKKRLLGLQNNLLNFAYQLTTSRDAAKDRVQDTTLKALDNEEKYVDNINFKGWVFTIMRNIFINNYRRQVRSATVIDTTEDLYHLNLSQESGLETPEGSVAAKEISAAIDSFADEYKIPFTYVYSRLQVRRNRRNDAAPPRHCQKPHIFRTQAAASAAKGLQVASRASL